MRTHVPFFIVLAIVLTACGSSISDRNTDTAAATTSTATTGDTVDTTATASVSSPTGTSDQAATSPAITTSPSSDESRPGVSFAGELPPTPTTSSSTTTTTSSTTTTISTTTTTSPPTVLPADATFETNMATLTAAGAQRLDAFLDDLAHVYVSALVVEAWTDDRADAGFNQQLATERAQSVIDYIVSKRGDLAGRITPIPHGESDPPTPCTGDCPGNRLVRITVNPTD